MTAASVAERDSNSIIEGQLNARAATLAETADADVLGYIGPMAKPADDEIKDAIEVIDPKRAALLVLIETSGGYITVVERIAQILRHHYRQVVFAVPTFAMSAGTVLVMSGDAIWMDYASTLGPIDPQVMGKSHHFVPALGYLEQYDRLIEKSREGTLTTAELAYLIQNFDPAELYRYEQERELSIALLEKWLAT
jgi:ClpP class serine protease